KKYGLVISDWNMEPMTGYELLKEVRGDPGLSKTPFIMVTAESKTENVIAAKKAGVDNYIVKPFNAQTLKAKIDAVFTEKSGAGCGSYQISRRVTAFGMTLAAANTSAKSFTSGSSREPNSSAWMPEVTNRQSTPSEVAPVRSVRTESPMARTRASAAARPRMGASSCNPQT